MSSPSKTAQYSFSLAKITLQGAKSNEYADLNFALKSSLMEISWGLENLAVGLRATYMLIEELQREVRQLKQSRPS